MKLQHPEIVRLDLPARYSYLHLLSDSIAEMLRLVDNVVDAETLTYNIQLAVHEICTNIIGHAYAGDEQGRITVLLALHPAPPRIEIELRDSGRTFDPRNVPELDLDEARVHGYGMFIVRSLMDTVDYTTEAGLNHWHLRKNLYLEGSRDYGNHPARG